MARAFGESVLTSRRRPFVIALKGDLGTGKTTFIKGLAKGLGIRRRITSPTFLMTRRYDMPKNKPGYKNFHHVDAYRMKTERDLEVTGVKKALNEESNVVAVEWADLIKGFLPKDAVWITISHKKENGRVFLFKQRGKK